MENILKEAKNRYPKGTMFISVSNNLKSPLKVVSLSLSENYKGFIHNTEGGIIYDGENWAQKV